MRCCTRCHWPQPYASPSTAEYAEEPSGGRVSTLRYALEVPRSTHARHQCSWRAAAAAAAFNAIVRSCRRHRKALKVQRGVKSVAEHAAYAKLVAARQAEEKVAPSTRQPVAGSSTHRVPAFC
jgi:hypothetical protein